MGNPRELVGRTIAGKFLVEDLIGSGAMGAVYRARQVALDKAVAIKVLHRENAEDPTFAARFHREAKAASRLNHPNSMQVIDFGAEPDGLLYIAMEYLDGRSLHAVLRQDLPLAPARIADILMQTLAALAVAHDMGVVHRDLKPENIMVLSGTDDDGRPRDVVKVCDFGIAKITDSRAYRSSGEQDTVGPVTTAGYLVGTPEYMSPEQGKGEKLDARSDLYSVGVILYEMLTGRLPFEAENAIGVVLKHVTEEPPLPSHVALGADSRLEAVCLRAMSKRREDRYPSAREMRADLRAVAEGTAEVSDPGGASDRRNVQVVTSAPAAPLAETVQLPAPPPPPPTLMGTTAAVEGAPRRRRLVVFVAALVALGAVGGIGAILERSHAASAARSQANDLEPSAAAAVTSAAQEPIPALVDPAEHETDPHAAAGVASHGSRHASHGGTATRSAQTTATASAALAEPPAAASSSNPAAAPTALATTASAIASGTAPPSAPPIPSATASPVPAPASDTSFDPSRGYVDVGIIDVQGVREPAVRGALHGVGLSACYRAALKARAVPATGVATLSLAFDQNGVARSAILTGGEFLPGLTRCVQGASTGLRVDRSQIDQGGGTADATLSFKLP